MSGAFIQSNCVCEDHPCPRILASLRRPTSLFARLSRRTSWPSIDTEPTVTAFKTLLLSLADATDMLRVPLLTDDMTAIWASSGDTSRACRIRQASPCTQSLVHQGRAACCRVPVSNVGNERGEVLITVLTESESDDGLAPLARGLVDRYRRAGRPRPLVLYTDRDCCRQDGPSKLVALFDGWEGMPVRLDVWHFMHRIALGVTSESHPLYGTWDAADHRLLQRAKRGLACFSRPVRV